MTNNTPQTIEPTAEAITQALETILAYAYSDERDHYEELPEKDRKGHIFESLVLLGYYLQQYDESDAIERNIIEQYSK